MLGIPVSNENYPSGNVITAVDPLTIFPNSETDQIIAGVIGKISNNFPESYGLRSIIQYSALLIANGVLGSVAAGEATIRLAAVFFTTLISPFDPKANAQQKVQVTKYIEAETRVTRLGADSLMLCFLALGQVLAAGKNNICAAAGSLRDRIGA